MKRIVGVVLAISWMSFVGAQDFHNPLAKQPHKYDIQYFMNADKRVVPPTVDYDFKRMAKRNKKKEPWTIVDYFDNGNVQMKTFSFVADPISTEYQDSYVEFYPSGDTSLIQEYRVKDKYGRYKKFFRNGKVEEQGTYKKNRLQGDWKSYYKNGELKEQGEYRDFKRYGMWKFYSEKGLMVRSGPFEDGVEQGDWKEYHENGKLKGTFNYEAGKLKGDVKMYHATGELFSEVTYSMGRAHGKMTKYHRNGKVSMLKSYDQGLVVGDYLELADNGDTIVSGELLENVPNGHWKFSSSDHNVIREEAYSAGKLKQAADYYDFGKKQMITTKTENGFAYECFDGDDAETACMVKYSFPTIKGGSLQAILLDDVLIPVDQRYNARMFITFSINAEGKVVDAEIQESANTYFDNEVLHRLNETKWNPGWNGLRAGSFKGEMRIKFNMDGSRQVALSDFAINSSIQDQQHAYRYTTLGFDPEYPGGEEAMFKFISENLVYPEFAKEEGLSGTCYVRFKINASGMISNATILKSAHPSMDYEAIKVVENMPDWNPAIIDGKPVSSYNNIPFRFTLN